MRPLADPSSSASAPPAKSPHSEQNLRFILGLKLSQLRKQKGLPLKDVAGRADLAISYLNEIEKGKKYPKPEKILALAKALGTTYDELVSLQLGEKLHPLSGVLKSGVLEEIPLEVFGLTPTGLLEMMSASPEKISALFDTFVKIAHRFDVTIEHLLLAAMRSYVEQNQNYFEDIELAAEKFRKEHEWARTQTPDVAKLREHLTTRHGYTVDDSALQNRTDLQDMRAVTFGGESAQPRMFLNSRLSLWQQAFLLAREIGYREMDLVEPVTTSPIVKVASFDQLLNNFRASYFAGAMLLDRHLLVSDLRQFFARTQWDGNMLVAINRRYQATPEMFFHRLSQIVPRFFGLEQMYFVRFDHHRGTTDVRIGKELHYQRMHGTHSVGVNEHYCRRWMSLRSLHELDARRAREGSGLIVAGAQRSRFYSSNDEYFSISLAHPRSANPEMNSCVTLGFLMNDTFKKSVNFWNDPSLPNALVADTCERCGIADCESRAVPAIIRQREDRRSRQLAALAQLQVER
jgi:transcriptional regulator with XRE-family HTH domain/predicted transcriptional regulator